MVLIVGLLLLHLLPKHRLKKFLIAAAIEVRLGLVYTDKKTRARAKQESSFQTFSQSSSSSELERTIAIP